MSRWFRFLIFFTAFFSGYAIAAPAPGFGAQVDAFVSAEMSRQQLPGLAVGMFRGGEVVLSKGYGFANLEHRVPVHLDTVFQSASVGKQFTAVAVMLLVEDGKIALDESIRTYYPDAPAAWQAITPRHLLTHTSGIADYMEDLGEGRSMEFDVRRDYTEDELRLAFYELPLEFPPGARYHYSNTGYALLGFLVRHVCGQFYGDVLAERVFKPLGMTTARVISEEDIVANRAAGYRLMNGQVKNQEWYAPMVNTSGDGALHLSLNDYLAWDRGLRAGALLSAKGWQQVYAPVRLTGGKHYPYGFGWEIDRSGGKPWYYHSGGSQGFVTFISRYTGDDLTVVVLANLVDADTRRFVDGIAAIVDPSLAQLRPSGPAIDNEPEVARRVGALLSKLAAGALPSQDLLYPTPAVISGMDGYTTLLQPLGPLQHLELLYRREMGDDHESTFRARYAQHSLRVTFQFTPELRVADITDFCIEEQ